MNWWVDVRRVLARIGKLSACVGRRLPVRVRKASFMTGSMRRAWALRHQTEVQHFDVEWTRAKFAVRSVMPRHPSPNQQAASIVRRVMSAFCELTRGVKIDDAWASCPMLLRGIWAWSRSAGFRRWSWFSAHVSFVVVKVEDCPHHSCSAELQLPCLEVLTHSRHVLA